jgi:primosomal protein N' (replication factor Y)
VQAYCRVAVDSPVPALDRPFDYIVPDRLAGKVRVGSVVRVVLHGRSMRAFVTELLDSPAVPNPRPVRAVIAPDPVFMSSEIQLARWTARRYVVPLGLVLHDAVPGRFSAPRADGPPSPAPGRTDGPSALAQTIRDRRAACVFPRTIREEIDVAAFVAGEAASADGRTLIICPRVEQAEAVAAAIPGSLVLHGEDRPAERAASWAAARDERAHVVVGGRSALFVPLPKLRAVCVLSAHDRSLKSERAPRIHAPIVAMKRAETAGAAFVLSSPAPPVEFAADQNVAWIEGPKGNVRAEIARPRGGPVTPRLVEVVRSAIERGSDALVFVGRKGDALRLRCADCGWRPTCPECGAGLAQTQTKGLLVCRVCGRETDAPATCRSCGGALVERGWGHERVARALERAELGAPVVRMVRGDVPDSRPHPSVLVGTLAAAHAAADVGSVCVADLDELLARPDFRAAERALQTLHDLAGVLRPQGRFLVQTHEPEHHAVQAFTRRSFRYFFDREIRFREETGYPPFGVVVRVSTDAHGVEELAGSVEPLGARVVGAVERRGVTGALVRGPALEPLLEPLRVFAAAHSRAKIDVDPVDVL